VEAPLACVAGGLKLWECAIDLIRYLREEAVSLQGVRVLELGCGHGLPGVYAATQVHAGVRDVFQGALSLSLSLSLSLDDAPWMGLPHLNEARRLARPQGASEVTLQDYNREVLVELTIPNATANLQRDGKSTDAQPSGSCRLRYLAGDWARLHEHVEAHAYEVILTSDTVYSVANLPKLYRLIKHVRARKGSSRRLSNRG
jgi:predicted nicotinamide N-methyase